MLVCRSVSLRPESALLLVEAEKSSSAISLRRTSKRARRGRDVVRPAGEVRGRVEKEIFEGRVES